MEVKLFFYRILIASTDLQVHRFLGTAFPITPDGGLLTCRHVLDVQREENEVLAVFDNERNRIVPIECVEVSQHLNLDAAFIPNALQRGKAEFLPILSPDLILMGESVYTVGYYSSGVHLNVGYFKGNIVNFSNPEQDLKQTSISLSYAVIEGLSGSPVLTYHNGPKIVGLCRGNIQSRVVASEVVEYKDDHSKLQETITRIVELGQAYHAATLITFLQDIDVHGFVVSSERVNSPGLSS